MTVYKLYVVDSEGRSAGWPDHTNGFRGKQCISFADYAEANIVIEHGDRVTFIHLTPDGEIDMIESFDDA